MVINDLDVLIMGFPKSGTTSLADWLDKFDNLLVSSPKETFSLTPEFKTNVKRAGSLTLSQAFPQKNERQLLIEATTLNVYSDQLYSAVDPTSTKAIFVVRDPLQLVESWHEQMVFAGDAYSDALVDSWEHSLSLEKQLPEDFRQCYSCLFKQAFWIKKWTAKLGHANVLILENRELSDSVSLTAKMAEFLAVDLSDAPELERSNVRLVRSAKWLRYLKNPALRKLLRQVDPDGNIESRLKQALRRAFKSRTRIEIPEALKARIQSAFKDDVNELALLLKNAP